MIGLDAFVVVEVLTSGALAEATDSVLYTSDEKLCQGHRARVVLFTH
jgi:hypothetical protein